MAVRPVQGICSRIADCIARPQALGQHCFDRTFTVGTQLSQRDAIAAARAAREAVVGSLGGIQPRGRTGTAAPVGARSVRPSWLRELMLSLAKTFRKW
jgi:hypothetical protein